MDALDPDKMVEIVGNLYKDDTFTSSIFNALSEDGVVSLTVWVCDYTDSTVYYHHISFAFLSLPSLLYNWAKPTAFQTQHLRLARAKIKQT